MFEVERFLQVDQAKGLPLVKWKEIDDIEATWEPTASLKENLGDYIFEKLMKELEAKNTVSFTLMMLNVLSLAKGSSESTDHPLVILQNK
jgi:hypothetical protein